MKIRTRLTLQFIGIVTITLVLVSLAIFFFSEGHRKEDFYDRLRNKARNTAMLLIQFEEVNISLLRKIETDNPVSLPKEKIIIFDYSDSTLFSTDYDSIIKISAEMLDEVRLRGEVRYKQDKYEILGFLFTDKYDRFVVIAGAEDIFGNRKIANLGNILAGVMSISIVLLWISGWIYAGRALKPISNIVSQVNDISVVNLNTRLDEGKNKDEIDELASTFNKMLGRLETAFNSQKNFIANASHELRTPLTAITGQLDVVLMQNRDNEEYKKVITSVLEDMKNLNNISNRLLLLAQASAELTEMNTKPLRIDEVIWSCREDLRKREKDYQVEVVLDESLEDEAGLIIHGDENLLRTMVMNLLENGCKYSDSHKVQVTIRHTKGRITLVFRDNGIGIMKEDLAHIFEPFRRGQNAYPVKGHGIGLSLVDHIVRLHNGTIDVKSKVKKGTTFTVSFPQDA